MTVYEWLMSDIARNTRSLEKWKREQEFEPTPIGEKMIAAYEADNRALQLAIDNLPVEVAGREVE